MLSRRHFLQLSATGAGAFALGPLLANESASAADGDKACFFLVGDTHYLADLEKTDQLDATSRDYTERLIGWLNQLPDTEIAAEAGGGKVRVQGVVHAGDLIHSGDLGGTLTDVMQATEWGAWTADYGLNGGDGKLKLPVREVFGNHDCPHGKGIVLDSIIERNKRRKGLTGVSESGLHYSWDWSGIHFVNLGLIVGETKEVARPRRFNAMGSFEFLVSDLAKNVGSSGRPVVITHHIDVARYSREETDPAKAPRQEWDYADLQAYYKALTNYRIAAILYGHTHSRRIFPWDGTLPPETDPKAQPTGKGILVVNTDNGAHFNMEDQAFLHLEVSAKEVLIREFATLDGWKTGKWTPQTWRFAT